MSSYTGGAKRRAKTKVPPKLWKKPKKKQFCPWCGKIARTALVMENGSQFHAKCLPLYLRWKTERSFRIEI